MCSHRPHFVGLNGHPYGAPIWVPYRAPISRFHFVKLLPLRGRHVCACGGQEVAGCSRTTFRLKIIGHTSWASMGTPMGHPYGYPIGHPFLGSTSLNYCPFGAGMYACGGQDMVHICSVPLRDFFSLRAPSGPKCPLRVHMGTL